MVVRDSADAIHDKKEGTSSFRVYKPAPFVYRISKLFFSGTIKTLKGFQTPLEEFLNVEMFFLGKY